IATVTPPVAAALARSRVFAVELVPEAADAATSEFEQLENNARLEPLLGATAFAAVRARLRQQGVTEPVIERLKPWAAMLKLSRMAPQVEQATLDDRLFVAARVRRLQILPLELLEEQISAFDTVPLATQIALLNHVLENRAALAANVEPTIAAWLDGDLAALARISERSAEQYPQLREHYDQLARHLIVDRTALMHHRLFMPLRKGRVFVAIGALHLYGENGLLALLSADGYRLQKLW
ncbi:MAG: TraB/GumN family protein, partial [Betaproteobacteria bacterium]